MKRLIEWWKGRADPVLSTIMGTVFVVLGACSLVIIAHVACRR